MERVGQYPGICTVAKAKGEVHNVHVYKIKEDGESCKIIMTCTVIL